MKEECYISSTFISSWLALFSLNQSDSEYFIYPREDFGVV